MVSCSLVRRPIGVLELTGNLASVPTEQVLHLERAVGFFWSSTSRVTASTSVSESWTRIGIGRAFC